MSHFQPITLSLPQPVLADLERLARREGRGLTEIVTKALKAELSRSKPAAKRSLRTDEHLLAPIRALLAADLARARGWDDLQTRLAYHGYTFRERGGGLALYDLRTANRVCKASELSVPYATLIRRFGAPFPGHAHRHLVDRVLPKQVAHSLSGTSGPDDEEEDIVLIEPF